MGIEEGHNLSDKGKEDFELVLRARENQDERAYAELMMKYRNTIYYMMLKMVGNEEDAEDLTLEAFGKAFNRLHQYSPSFAFSTWLFKIASNNCIDFIRKKRISTLSLDQPMNDSDENSSDFSDTITNDNLDPEEKFIRKQKIRIMREIVDQLKPRYRELIVLRYFREYSYEEIAEHLELPLGTIKAQLYRAREQLYQLMKNKKDRF
jgi:RNA polymerase sigma-70 factor (ECF subfamily)